MLDTSLLKAGDVILYRPTKGSIFGWIISIKSWHKISHCECYIGDSFSVASRDGIGVNNYPVRDTEAAVVLRIKPEYKFSLPAALKWFLTVRGQKYDWLGLLVFTLAVHQGSKDRMFCSEFVTNFLRAGGVEPFSPETSADSVAPFQFETSPIFDLVWSDK